MKRNRKNSIKKERIIMIASSAFVLAALTLTGIYMKDNNVKSKNDGYTLDFTALEENADNKYQEIAQNKQAEQDNLVNQQAQVAEDSSNMEDDLDYMPMEAGSNRIEIPGLTDGVTLEQEKTVPPTASATPEPPAEAIDEKKQEAATQKMVVSKTLNFSEAETLTRPVSGQVLLPYSMESSIYFATLDQYKYNSALILSAQEGESVLACTEAKVIDIFENEEIGHAVTLDLGDGYLVTYGQLKDIEVKLNSYVNPGENIASVAAPTKYFSTEGSNLYFQMTKDGSPVNPEFYF